MFLIAIVTLMFWEMQRFVLKALEHFIDLHRSISRPLTPTVGENAGVDKYRDARQGPTPKESGDSRQVEPSVRQKLNDLSSFRIQPTSIKFISGDSHKSGGNADVARATYRPGNGGDEQVVAVKKIRYHRDTKGRKLGNEFVHEVNLIAGLSHENIVQLIGFVEDLESGTAWIVLSWEPNGNVSDFLAKGQWEIPERISLIKDTFEGIKYLHTRQPPICHGDLKSFNILVNSDYRAVITDFGSARANHTPEDVAIGDQRRPQAQGRSTAEQASPPIQVNAIDNQLTLTGPAWSLRWAAPEVVNGERPGLSSDIWAAGWICWEVMTDNVPFPELNAAGVITLTVIKGEVPSPREDGQLGQIVALCSLMTDCWAFDPKVRPSISRCCTELQWMPSAPLAAVDASGSKQPSIGLLCGMGQMNLKQDDYANAALFFQQALPLTVSAGNQKMAANLLRRLGDCYRGQSKYAQAEQSYTRAHEIFVLIGDDLGRADALLGFGRLYRLQHRFTEAEESFTRAQAIFTHVGDDLGQADASLGLGHIYREQSKYTEVEESFARAQEIYARIGVELGRGNALNELGEISMAQSKYPEAEDLFSRAYEVYTRIGSDVGRANALRGLGHVYREQSKYTEAEESYTRAQEVYTHIGDDLGRANTLRGIGHLRREQGRNNEAVSHYIRATKIYIQLGRTGDAQDCLDWATPGSD